MWEQSLILQGQIGPQGQLLARSCLSRLLKPIISGQGCGILCVCHCSYISISLPEDLSYWNLCIFICESSSPPHTPLQESLFRNIHPEQNMPVIYFSQLFIEWPLSARLYAKGLIQSYERKTVHYRLCPIEAILLEKETSNQITNLHD